MPSVNRLHAELQDRGLSVYLMNIREDADLVRRTVRQRGYTAPVLLDRTGEVAGKRYGVWGVPTTYLIDRQGRLVGRTLGAREWDGPAARKLLLDLLDAPSP